MGQKVNPNMMRLGIVRSWQAKWFAGKKDFAQYLCEDIKLRKAIRDKWSAAGLSTIDIERPSRSVKITVDAGRPGVIIGKKGDEVDKMRLYLSRLVQRPVHLSITEVKKPELNAVLVAENVAMQLTKRAMYRRVLKRTLQQAMKSGAQGVKVCLSGRLGGAEIARTEWSKEGRVPLHTFRADIDYAEAVADTTYGVIGVKVWIFKGEKMPSRRKAAPAQADRGEVK
jgi:small subunit ribosomal protein S3